MNDLTRKWTGGIEIGSKIEINALFEQLCQAFNESPYFKHSSMQVRVVDGQLEGLLTMQPFMVGNVAYQILHGGATATFLDSIGGVVAMGELYKKATPETMQETLKQVSRVATLDIRVDYLKPGRGEYFTARAEVLRLGRKGCTMRMNMFNDQAELIATAMASYAY